MVLAFFGVFLPELQRSRRHHLWPVGVRLFNAAWVVVTVPNGVTAAYTIFRWRHYHFGFA